MKSPLNHHEKSHFACLNPTEIPIFPGSTIKTSPKIRPHWPLFGQVGRRRPPRSRRWSEDAAPGRPPRRARPKAPDFGISAGFLGDFCGMFLWDFYWISMGCLGEFYDGSMGFLWNFYDVSMGFL